MVCNFSSFVPCSSDIVLNRREKLYFDLDILLGSYNQYCLFILGAAEAKVEFKIYISR